MTQNSVGWFEIYVADMTRARQFYQSVFSVELERLNSGDIEMWAFPAHMDRYGAGGALVRIDGVEPGGNGTIVYFSCEDCAIECARAAASGGIVIKQKFPIGEYGHVALVHDSEGNIIGLHSVR
ncbi:MAG: VOC family protein [Lysobacterales bacterium]